MTVDRFDQDPMETLQALQDQVADAPAHVYEVVSSVEGIADFKDEAALHLIGLLVDTAGDVNETEGLEDAISLAEEFLERDLEQGHRSRMHYYMGNAYSSLCQIEASESGRWWWENAHLEQEIFHYRMALDPEELTGLSEGEACQMYTNLGNALSRIGRFTEAIRQWNLALSINDSFGPAKGQKGIGFTNYAQAHYDRGQASVLLRAAHDQLDSVVDAEYLFPTMREQFQRYHTWLEDVLTDDVLDEEFELEEYSLGDSAAEQQYRQWCLDLGLFLNPLNDIGPHSIAAQDVFHLGSVSSSEGEKIVSCVGFFNQMKQEYVSSRYLLYSGLEADEPHFADLDVHLENTLDYPVYSFNSEQVRIAMRIAYSLFDKVATFLQHYFELDYIESHKVNFGNVWYKSPGKNALAPVFVDRENWPLRGLFWLSKDLEYDSEIYVEDSLDPGATELRETRNELEHGYLKLHQDLWPGSESEGRITDALATSVYRDEFESRAVTTVRKARAALLYLSLGIQHEERMKQSERDDDDMMSPFRLGRWEDHWKR